MANKAEMKLALEVLTKIRKYYADYSEEVKAYYADSANKGYTFPACIHGSSRWTDYDNICQGCEDGFTYFDYERDARIALDMIQYAVKQTHERYELYKALEKSKAPIHEDMLTWIFEPMKVENMSYPY